MEFDRHEIDAHKALAAAVLMQAMSDLSDNRERPRALLFLTSPDMKRDRALWLAWLGMNEAGFQKLIAQRTFQGQRNKLPLVMTGT